MKLPLCDLVYFISLSLLAPNELRRHCQWRSCRGGTIRNSHSQRWYTIFSNFL